MVFLSAAFWVLTICGLLSTSYTAIVCFHLLYKHSLKQKIWKKLDYQMIIFRILLDGLTGATAMPYFIVSILDLYSEILSIDVTFLVGLVSIIIIEMRSYLAVIIAIERVLATTCPIKFWRYRKHFLANILIFCFVILTGLAVPFMMFWVCELKLPIPVGCTSFSCASPKCYQDYRAASAMTFSSSNAMFSGILCLKLLCLSMKHTNLSNDLRRANLLSLTDGFSSIVSEFIPALLFKWKIVELNGIGPVLGVLRQIGRVVEVTVMVKLME